MKRNNKKGFTLVELLVVIAILAVLASVSVVGYLGFVKKARLSNDETVITQMNIGLQADAAERDNKYTYAGDAIQALYLQGWNDGKMKPYSSNYEYAYSLEENKMYLIDENDDVVYPQVKDATFKSTLWGFYYNAVEGSISGVTKYIAMVNIENESNFSTLVGTEKDYTIDLNGYYINLIDENDSAKKYEKTTIQNGYLVNGEFKNEDNYANDNVKIYTKISSYAEIKENNTYTNMVWSDANFNNNYSTLNNLTFKNCIFYNAALGFQKANFTFEDCSFIGQYTNNGNSIKSPIKFGGYTNTTGNIVIKNCTFTNTARGIHLQWEDDQNTPENINVKIEGCTFNGGTEQKFAALQIVTKELKVEFINNTINDVKNSSAIVRFNSGYNGFNETSSLSTITFRGNTVASSVYEKNYVDLDFTGDGDTHDCREDYSDFYNAALKKFKEGLK